VEEIQDQARLVDALARSLEHGSATGSVARLETHISYVLLTGDYAYKIKKAVDFGFLDFTALAARRFFCEEELRLNRRLAPAVYLEVVPITGSAQAPVVSGVGPALEYAVKMREFSQDALASRLLAEGALRATDIDALAATIDRFHRSIDVASPTSAFGTPEGILRIAQQNFAQIRPLLSVAAEREELDALRAWTDREHAARREALVRRREEGFVRECHGDLHLGNIARIDGELVVFDCIEFNESMRWIDVMSEVAFTVMDLADRGRPDLAHRFLNAYLELTGDYAGLAVLPFYLAYRALVRAKIAVIRASQLDQGAAQDEARAESRGYLRLAQSCAETPRPALVLTCGLSGSGKTTLSQALLEAIGAIRIRSDVERKRLHGIGPLERGGADIAEGLYDRTATDATYDRLRTLASGILEAGRIAIVDATFLRHAQRVPFHALAKEYGVPCAIVAFEASEATLRERIAIRRAEGRDASDADIAVLEHQIATREALTADEKACALEWNAEAPVETARSPGAWDALIDRIRG